MSYELAEHDRMIAAMIQAGTIEAVDHANARCRVRISDDGEDGAGYVSAWVPWGSLGGGEVRNWRPPSIGEQTLLLCPSGDPAAGFALPGFYSDQHGQANDHRPHTVAWKMPDGCLIEYDWQAGALQVDGSKTVKVRNADTIDVESGGQVTVKCPTLVVDCPDSTFKGNVTVEKRLTYMGGLAGSTVNGGGGAAAEIEGDVRVRSGEVSADDIGLKAHHHIEQGDGAPTSSAQ